MTPASFNLAQHLGCVSPGGSSEVSWQEVSGTEQFGFWSLCFPNLLEKRGLLAQNNRMDQRFVIEKLRHHEPELKAAGILHISVFRVRGKK